MRTSLLAILVMISATLKAADRTRLFEGTIGNQPVVVELTQDEKGWTGRYFYKKYKADIDLQGKLVNKKIILSNREWRTNIVKESLTLTETTAGVFKGKWQNRSGKTLAVSLQPIDAARVTNPYAKLPLIKKLLTDDPYAYVKSAYVVLNRDSIFHRGAFEFQYLHADHSSAHLPIIIKGGSEIQTTALNNILIEKLISKALITYECDIAFNIQNVYVYNNIISLFVIEYYDCEGAAHPDDAEYGITLNSSTGRELKMEELLHLAKEPLPHQDSDEWFEYRKDKYAPKLKSLVTQLYPNKMNEDECDYSDISCWEFSDWYLAKDGMFLLPSFPHAMSPCKMPEWCVIPYKTLYTYIDRDANIDLPKQ